jgi:hypothetical protein
MSRIVADRGAGFASVHVMDTESYRCAMRFVRHTLSMTALLLAPAILQAALVIRPDAIAMQDAAALMSCALAAAVVVVPVLLQNLVAGHR